MGRSTQYSREELGEFQAWLSGFEDQCDTVGWKEEDAKLKAMDVCLIGEASQFYEGLTAKHKGNYDHLVKGLGEKMSIGAKELAWRIQLQRSQRGLGEELEQYVDRLYLLAHQAYP